MNREAVHDRLEARKELAIAKVAPKLVGVEDVAEAEEILNELRDERRQSSGNSLFWAVTYFDAPC